MNRSKSSTNPAELSQLNLNSAGIDVGATSHFVAVPADRSEQPVQEFEAFTADLYRLADWLTECGVATVAMESTGVYWIPLFGVLEERGFQVMLVDPRRIKNVPGRKSDVVDCQWLQQLHTYGLFSAAFRPDEDIRRLRSYLRQQAMLVEYASHHVQHMQKALTQMNLKLQHVIIDITGKTGMAIIQVVSQADGGRWFQPEAPERKRATLPDPQREVNAAPAFGLSPAEKRAMDLITDHPMIPREHLSRWLGVSDGRVSQMTRSLVNDWRLEDLGRRREAGVPEDVVFRTKGQLAQEMIGRAVGAGVPFAWVAGDTVYGNDRRLRWWLEEQDIPYVLAVKSNEPLWASTVAGAAPVAVRELAQGIPDAGWHRLSAGDAGHVQSPH